MMKRNEMRKWIRQSIAFLTVFMLTLSVGGAIPAAIAERQLMCGLEEHTHTDACFEMKLVCGKQESNPTCVEQRHFVSNFQTHSHTKKCFDRSGNIRCGIAENAYFHEHNKYCYDEQGNLVCGLASIPRHRHTDACYGYALALTCGFGALAQTTSEKEAAYNGAIRELEVYL